MGRRNQNTKRNEKNTFNVRSNEEPQENKMTRKQSKKPRQNKIRPRKQRQIQNTQPTNDIRKPSNTT